MPFWNCADQHRFGVAALALFEALAHADDRGEAELEGRLGALQDGLIGLAEILAALAVADDARGWRPRPSIIGPEISPVKAPSLAQAMFCAPTRMCGALDGSRRPRRDS